MVTFLLMIFYAKYAQINRFSLLFFGTVSTIAFGRRYSCRSSVVDLMQIKCPWSLPGQAYGIDTVKRWSGCKTADHFYLNVHVRLEKYEDNKTKLVVMADIVWEKSCMLKSKVEKDILRRIQKFYNVFAVFLKYYKAFQNQLYIEKFATTLGGEPNFTYKTSLKLFRPIRAS